MDRSTKSRSKQAAVKATTPAKKSKKQPPAKKKQPQRQGQKAAAAARKAAAPARKTAAAPAKRSPAAKAAPKKRPPAKTAAPAAKKQQQPKPAKKAAASGARGKAATAATGPVKAPRSAKPVFGAKFLAQQQQALLDERANYTRQANSLRAEADALVADFEAGDVQFDEESGEGDTLNVERERDLALSAQASQAVEEIDHALAKFATGTYGICEISGEPIPVERLEAIPWAREQVKYKTGGLGRR